ncbi:MAG: hypothetical protein RIR31_765 [Bacteroidota bacterium]
MYAIKFCKSQFLIFICCKTLQQFSNSAIQQFSNSAIQQFSNIKIKELKIEVSTQYPTLIFQQKNKQHQTLNTKQGFSFSKKHSANLAAPFFSTKNYTTILAKGSVALVKRSTILTNSPTKKKNSSTILVEGLTALVKGVTYLKNYLFNS